MTDTTLDVTTQSSIDEATADESTLNSVAEIESTNVIAQDADTTEATATQTTAEESEEHQKKTGFEKRVSKLNQRIADKEAEAVYWRQLALQNQTAQTAQQPQQIPDQKPTLAQYNNDFEAYTNATVEWRLQQTLTQQAQQQVAQSYQQKESEFEKTHPDYRDLVASVDTPLPRDMLEALAHANNGPAIAYYLAQNEDQLDKLVKMSTGQRLLEMGKIQYIVESQNKPATAKTITAKPAKVAPAPIETVKGSGSGSSMGEKSVYEMTAEEVNRAYHEKMRGKRNR